MEGCVCTVPESLHLPPNPAQAKYDAGARAAHPTVCHSGFLIKSGMTLVMAVCAPPLKPKANQALSSPPLGLSSIW